MKNLIRKYLKEEDGLVTIEWVGIAAVVVIAGIIISGIIMGGADKLGGDVDTQLRAVGTSVQGASVPTFDGTGGTTTP